MRFWRGVHKNCLFFMTTVEKTIWYITTVTEHSNSLKPKDLVCFTLSLHTDIYKCHLSPRVAPDIHFVFRLKIFCSSHGGVAQMVERSICIREVMGSMPISSNIVCMYVCIRMYVQQYCDNIFSLNFNQLSNGWNFKAEHVLPYPQLPYAMQGHFETTPFNFNFKLTCLRV